MATSTQTFQVEITASGLPPGSGATAGKGTDRFLVGDWRSSEDVVPGWDWTSPPQQTAAALSGAFQFSSYDYPTPFRGRRLFKVDLDWRVAEPTQGSFDLSKITAALANASYDGVQLDVRGTTCVNPLGRVTTPDWLASKGIPVITESNGMACYDITHPSFQALHWMLIDKIGATTVGGHSIPAHPKLVSQIVHGVSHTQLEEWTGTQAGQITNDPSGVKQAKTLTWLQRWIDVYGASANKLGWVGDQRPWLEITKPLIDAGMGTRGGSVESWLGFGSSPTYADAPVGITLEPYHQASGAPVAAAGYLVADLTDLRISTVRHFGDQNEYYKFETDPDSDCPPVRYQQNYRMAWLKSLMWRRNVLAVDRRDSRFNGGDVDSQDGFINASLMSWGALQLGQRLPSAPEAFCCLCQTYSRSYNPLAQATQTITLHNMERWLKQREVNGATTPTLKRGHGVNADDPDYGDTTQYGQWPFSPGTNDPGVLPQSLWHINLARKGASIGLTLDDGFLSGAAAVAVKVVFWDDNTETWKLRYRKASGVSVDRPVTNTNSGTVKTATFVLPDFAALAGAAADLWLVGPGATPFMFVRLIKL